MAKANMEISYWGDALLITSYVLNRVPSKLVETTPYELWFSRRPEFSHLKPWGYAAYVHTPNHKFVSQDQEGGNASSFDILNTPKNVFNDLENKDNLDEFESGDATFLENEFLKKGNIENKSSLRELNEFELSNKSDV